MKCQTCPRNSMPVADRSMSDALTLAKSHPFKENTDRVAIIHLPAWIMLQDVSQLFRRREQDITDSVLVQQTLRILKFDHIQVVAKHPSVVENINAAVDDHLHVGFIQRPAPTHFEPIQTTAGRRMRTQVRQDLRRILACNISLQCSFAHQRKTVNDAESEYRNQDHVNNRLVEVRLITRNEVQQLRQQGRRNDTQKKKETNVG